MYSEHDASVHAGVPAAMRKTLSGRCESAFGTVIDGLNGAGSLLIFAMMVLVGCDVVGRSFLGHPIYGVAELVSLSIVAIVFLQLGSTLRHQRMTRADLFLDGLIARRRSAGRLLSAAFNLTGCGVCVVIALATHPLLLHAWSSGQYIGVEGIFKAETWPVRLIVIVGSTATALQYLIHMVADLRACARNVAHPE